MSFYKYILGLDNWLGFSNTMDDNLPFLHSPLCFILKNLVLLHLAALKAHSFPYVTPSLPQTGAYFKGQGKIQLSEKRRC